MWPRGHLAVGTQFPDLVDKPLAWWLGVLPGGRTLAHSLLVAVPLVADLALTRAAVADLVAAVLAPGGFAAVLAAVTSPVALPELAVIAALGALWLADGIPPLPELAARRRERADRNPR